MNGRDSSINNSKNIISENLRLREESVKERRKEQKLDNLDRNSAILQSTIQAQQRFDTDSYESTVRYNKYLLEKKRLESEIEDQPYIVKFVHRRLFQIKWFGINTAVSFNKMIKSNSNYSVFDLIDKFPTKIVNDYKGRPREINDGNALDETSFTMILLKILLVLNFQIIPGIILIITVIYTFLCLNVYRFCGKKRFNGDDRKYSDVDNMINMLNLVYIPDYIFMISLCCLIYLLSTIYLYFSKYINTKKMLENPILAENVYRTHLFIGICSMILIINIIYYYSIYQKLGSKREQVKYNIYNYINYDYLQYLEKLNETNPSCLDSCELKLPFGAQPIKICSCKSVLMEVNKIENLEKYIKALQTEVMTLYGVTDLSLI